jgi:dCMP deaminase
VSEKWDLRYLELAMTVSTWSKDPSTQTGAVLVRDHRVLGLGYNGFPRLMPDLPELYADREEKYSRIVHCEVNALINAAQSVEGSTLYTWPFLSCDRCCVQMLQAGVLRFVAPRPTASQLERWGAAFERTKLYISECAAGCTEYDV